MGWRMVHVKEGNLLRVKLDNIEITKFNKRVYVPLSDINMIVLEGNRTTITTKLLTQLSRYNIGLVVCDDKYLPAGMYLPYGQYHHVAKRVMKQADWSEKQKDLLWQQVVSMKVANQIAFARYQGVEAERLDLMEQLASEITPGDKTNREGHIAKLYFNSLFGKSFTREDDIAINYALNFGYAIIRSCMARTIVGNGLITMLGIFHHNEYNSFNLADDLMEPFRPLMDCWIGQIFLGQNDYLDYQSRLQIMDFMNQSITINGQKVTMDKAMQLFVQSFIGLYDEGNVSGLAMIELRNFVEE